MPAICTKNDQNAICSCYLPLVSTCTVFKATACCYNIYILRAQPTHIQLCVGRMTIQCIIMTIYACWPLGIEVLLTSI